MCVSYTEHPRHYTITAMAWNPANNGTIAFCDAAGQLGTIEGNLSLEAIEENTLEDGQSYLQTVDVDEDGENAISLDKIKSSVSQPFLDLQKFEIDSHSIKGDDDDADAESIMSAPTLKLQLPFQPSSSPAHLLDRYMVWNSVGIIRCFNSDEENSIEVEFHDSSLHHALRLDNFLKHTLASLSEKAVLLACEAQDSSPSKIVCVLLNSWDGSREWSVELPEGEEALAIACAKNWVAVATDIRNLRFFTIAGAQREVLSLPGPVVCLAAQGNMLMVAYHHGSGLSFALLSVERHGVEALMPFQPLPLSPQATLQWVGFSDEGTPCTVDSVGILRVLSPKGFWLPLCDSQAKCKGKSDNYFIIGLSEKYQNVRCILCKGSHYPQTTPRPTVVEIPLKIPFCEISSEKSVLEEQFWRTQSIFDAIDSMCKVDTSYQREKEKAEKTIKETFIKLFALACRNGLEQRALDICRMMPSTQVVQLAIKYASKLGKMQLVERISDMSGQITSGQTGHLTESHSRFIRSNKFSLYKKESVKVNKSRSEDEDPFASQESSTGKENILLALKDKINSSNSSNSPANTSSTPISKKVNPFKKGVDSSPTTEVNGSKDVNIGGKTPNGVAPSSTSKVKQTGLWGKSPNSSALSGKKPTFPQWFEMEKSALQEEFPDLDSRALSSVAVKRFKEVVLKKGSGAKPKDSSPNLSDSSQNSLSESSQNTEADITQSSLIASSQTDATEEITTSSISNTETKFDIASDAKKRKLNDSGNPGGSFASKLAKFTFKK